MASLTYFYISLGKIERKPIIFYESLFRTLYSEDCDNNKTQYKQANLITILQATMFERDKLGSQ